MTRCGASTSKRRGAPAAAALGGGGGTLRRRWQAAAAALVLVRRSMKRTRGPNWKWEYIHAVLGWRRLVRRLVCLVLTLGLWWEIVLVLIFTVLIAFSSFFVRF